MRPSRYQKTYFPNPDSLILNRNWMRESYLSGAWISNNTYQFLNSEIQTEASWFPDQASQLWIYNLHYFDYLFDISDIAEIERLIEHWITNVEPGTKDAWHPYTVSLRVCNWIWVYSKWCTSHAFPETFLSLFLSSLMNQLMYLTHFLEQDVLGNHLIENCKALIVGGVFFQNHKWVSLGKRLLKRELLEQVLDDGGHYERAPMYHFIVLDDIFQIYQALKKTHSLGSLEWLKDDIKKMGQFGVYILDQGRIPLFNDSAQGITGPPEQLLSNIYTTLQWPLPESKKIIVFQESGYFIYKSESMTVYFDVGVAGPDCLLAHAHNDLLSYTLSLAGEDLVSDSGIYEYQNGNWRQVFRSTKAHNTLMVDEVEQHEIWSSFRVGRRGYPIGFCFDESEKKVTCGHTCYHHIGVSVNRELIFESDIEFTVKDIVRLETPHLLTSYIHFAPGVEINFSTQDHDGTKLVLVKNRKQFLLFILGQWDVMITTSWYSSEFGKKIKRPSIQVSGFVKDYAECRYTISCLEPVK